jgi:hypothetical protein
LMNFWHLSKHIQQIFSGLPLLSAFQYFLSALL